MRWIVCVCLLLAVGCGGHQDRWTVASGDGSRVVVFFHGAGASGDPMVGPPAALMHRLHDQGWTIIGANAGGDAWGNPSSVADYRKLVDGLDARTVVGIAESMGALPAMQLVREGRLDRLWMVSPVLNLQQMMRTSFAGSIRSAWHGTPPPGPAFWPSRPPGDLHIVADPNDPVVPTGANAALLADKLHVPMEPCAGGHVAPSCFARVEL